MKNKLAAAAVILTLCAPVTSQAVTIRGQPNCGAWLKETSGTAQLRNQTWIVGYISGIVMMAATEKLGDIFAKYSNDQIFFYLDNYCRANPLKDAGDGVIDLIANELNPKKQ